MTLSKLELQEEKIKESERILLEKLIGRFNEMELKKQGKPVQVRLREASG